MSSHGVLQQPEHAAVQEGETGDGWSPQRAESSGQDQQPLCGGRPSRVAPSASLRKSGRVAWMVWAGLL